MECEQGLGYLRDTPTWKCDGVTIHAKSNKSSQDPGEYLPRQHRAFNSVSELPQATASTVRLANEDEQARWTSLKSVELPGRTHMTQLARPIRPTMADRS